MGNRYLRYTLIVAIVFAALFAVLRSDVGFRLILNLAGTNNDLAVKPHQLYQLNAPVYLDARSFTEYSVSHLPGAFWVGDSNPDQQLATLEGLRLDTTIVVYCTAGMRSKALVERLREAGFQNAFNLYGGIINWYRAGNQPLDLNGEVTQQIHPYHWFWNLWL
jgi:rhodanese-related sulfurtransferase